MMAKQSPAAGNARAQQRASPSAGWPISPSVDVEDAEFETVLPEGPRQAPSRSRRGLKLLRKRSRPALPVDDAGGPGAGYWVLVALCATTAFWMTGGYTIMTGSAPTAPIAAQSTLPPGAAMKVTDITTNIAQRAGGNVLNVGANIRNDSSEAQLPPALIVSVTYSDGQKRERLLEPLRTRMKPGGNIRFETMLPALRGTIEKVDVRMASPA